MAERRMFAKTIIDSDAFIDMPVTARLLYYDLGMRADDDGFVNSPKKIMRMVGASQDDLAILITKKFIIPFDTGIVVIKHWRIHNYIQKDRYKPTKYEEEMGQLTVKENGSYTLDTDCIQDGYSLDTQVRLEIGKDRDRLDKRNKGKAFIPPTIDEVKAYCEERKNQINAEHFIDYYASQQWKKANGRPLTDWKAAVRTWEKTNYNKPKQIIIPMPEYEQHESKPATAETLEMVRKMQEEMK